MSNPTGAAVENMSLTRAERERIVDSRAKLQAVTEALNGIAPEKISDLAEIQDCLGDAEKSLKGALRSESPTS